MKSVMITALRVFAIMTFLLGIVYPFAVTVGAQAFFRTKANGSLVVKDGKVVGSSLLAQKFQSEKYFWARPSASDYGTLPSGASNFGPTSKDLKTAIADRQGKGLSGELLFASGSGLDPHITLNAALSQVPRIVRARHLGETEAASLSERVTASVVGRDFGFLGEERINVLELNLALDQH